MVWICFVLSFVAGGEAKADRVRRFLDSLQLPQLAVCGFAPESLVLDTWPDRSPRTVVVTYTTDNYCATELGIFRALRNGRFQRLAVSKAMPRRIALLDVTGNGVPEILVTQRPGNRAAPVVILRWDGTNLTRIGTTSDRAMYVDLNHDGVSEIVENAADEWNECGARVGRAYLQRLQNGKYVSVPDPPLSAGTVVSKATADRETFTTSLFLPNDASRRCRIRIINGARGGTRRAEEVELRVRRLVGGEKEEPHPGRLLPLRSTGAEESVQNEVELPSRCTMLDVTLDGPEQATVAIIVETIGVARR
jgi:hypothetical protein